MPLLEDFRDEDVVFHLEVYKGYYEISDWFLSNLRRSWPGSRILVVSDGDADPRHAEFRERHGAEVEYGEHLWGEGSSGPLWERRISRFLGGPGRWFMRMDSDAGVYRRLKSLPAKDCVFGTLYWLPRRAAPFAQGGAMGMTRGAAERISESGVLKSSEVAKWNHRWRGRIMASDDRGMGAAAKLAGVRMWSHPEFSCRWKGKVENPDMRYAIVHPCKDAKL